MPNEVRESVRRDSATVDPEVTEKRWPEVMTTTRTSARGLITLGVAGLLLGDGMGDSEITSVRLDT